MKKKYKVTHPVLGESAVIAEDKLEAVATAAKGWGVPWTSIARQCEFEVMGEAVPDEKPKRATRSRKKSEAVPG